ncbi:hypothetical protein AcW1_002540 [Taiwanofungus camphoratus]|nr:hypothetical protein AcW1_002540 [Antrodia cinnamomea]
MELKLEPNALHLPIENRVCLKLIPCVHGRGGWFWESGWSLCRCLAVPLDSICTTWMRPYNQSAYRIIYSEFCCSVWSNRTVAWTSIIYTWLWSTYKPYQTASDRLSAIPI